MQRCHVGRLQQSTIRTCYQRSRSFRVSACAVPRRQKCRHAINSLSVSVQPAVLSPPVVLKDAALDSSAIRQELEHTLLSVTDDSLPPMLQCAVKIFATYSRPNWSMPWQKQKQQSGTMSGFMIDHGQKLIVTSACYLEYSSRVQVKKQGDDTKYIAKVVAIAVDTDIALLSVDSSDFWKDTYSISWGSLPNLREKVIVVGYPLGGSTVSVTEGVVSRVELTNCQHLHDFIVGVQIDAAINSGNEGGPVFNAAGDLVGMAAYALGGTTENIGYVIPNQVIKHVLEDHKRNGYVLGQPSLGPIEYQPLESAALCKALGLAPQQHGVLVRGVAPIAPASALLQKHDVILNADGIPVAGDGTVAFRGKERISWVHILKQKFVGDIVRLEVLRSGQQLTLDVPLTVPSTASSLVPPHLNNADPSYFIVGGLVFVQCTMPYLKWVYGGSGDFRSRTPVKLLEQCVNGQRVVENEQIVILSQVLACDGTSGYENLPSDLQVTAFNGTQINNLEQLAKLVLQNAESSLTFELQHNYLVVLDAETASKDTQTIMRSYNIGSRASGQLKTKLGLE